MPKVPDGVYTIVLSYDTRTELGVLWSKRLINIEFPFYETCNAQYNSAKKEDNLGAMARASACVLAGWKGPRVRPGQACRVATVRFGRPQPDKLSAVARWYPGEEEICVEVDVIDRHFGVNAETPVEGSSVSLFFSPSGFDDTRTRITVVPSGPEDAPVIEAGGAGPVKAGWKRTEDGYRVEVSVPYASIKGYRKGWMLMPADVMVNSMNPDGRCALIAGPEGEPVDKPRHNVRYYAGLLRR